MNNRVKPRLLVTCIVAIFSSMIGVVSAQESFSIVDTSKVGQSMEMSQNLQPEGDNSGLIPLTPDLIRKIKAQFPSFWTYDDLPDELKARVVEQGGQMTLKLPKGQKVTLPNGDVVEADGTYTYSNGVTTRHIKDDSGTVIKNELVKPDGQVLKKGEVFTANDGRTYSSDY
jgi:hypothetical protein